MKKSTLNLMKFVKQVYNATDEHNIQPLDKKKLQESKDYWRPFQGESTDFAFTRFLVPYLCDYKDYSLFCDGDFLWRCNPAEILEYLAPDSFRGKHPELITSQHTKMNDKVNRPYPFKYWSSLMLFKNENCKKLDPNMLIKPQRVICMVSNGRKVLEIFLQLIINMINYYTFTKPQSCTLYGRWSVVR